MLVDELDVTCYMGDPFVKLVIQQLPFNEAFDNFQGIKRPLV